MAIGTVARITPAVGPSLISLYNLYPSATIIGLPATGYSSGQEDMAESKKLFQRIADRAKGDEPLLTNPEPEVQPEPEAEPAATEGEGEETDDAGEAQPETAEADAE